MIIKNTYSAHHRFRRSDERRFAAEWSCIMLQFFRRVPVYIIAFAASLLCTIFSLFSGYEISAKAARLRVVTTTSILADLAGEICGEAANVTSLMGIGTDPHTYQASAGDVRLMQQADVVLYNGLHLEGRMGEVFESVKSLGRTVICAGESIDGWLSDPVSGQPDPHIWFDVALWKKAACAVKDGLCEADINNAALYELNLKIYLGRLDELEAYIKTRVDELRDSERILITAHDAFRYFGNAYGFEVLAIQGISTVSEAGAADLSALADIISERQIGAVFIEAAVPAKSIEALIAAVRSRGFETREGGMLFADSLGGGDCNTYIAMVTSNIDTIVDALKVARS